MKNNLHSAVLMIAAVIFIGAACSSSGADCTGKVVYEGKTFEGKDKDAEKAKLNACNVYCREADPQFDAMYRIWLDSPKGKAAGSPSKKESIFKDADLLNYVTEICAKRCASTMNPEASCK